MAMSFDANINDPDLIEAIEYCQVAPGLRKIKEFLDRSNLSADLKAMLYDLAGFTIKVGEVVVAIGRRILSVAMWVVENIPHITLGIAAAVAISTLAGAVPLIGTVLSPIVLKLVLLLGVTAGAIEDIRMHAAKDAMDDFTNRVRAFSTVRV